MATAELAVAVPVLLVVLAVALGAIRLGIDRVRVVDAAHGAARLVARGEPRDAALSTARAAAPAGADVAISVSDGLVRVEVVAAPPTILRGIGLRTPSRGTATARLESAAPPGDGPTGGPP